MAWLCNRNIPFLRASTGALFERRSWLIVSTNLYTYIWLAVLFFFRFVLYFSFFGAVLRFESKNTWTFREQNNRCTVSFCMRAFMPSNGDRVPGGRYIATPEQQQPTTTAKLPWVNRSWDEMHTINYKYIYVYISFAKGPFFSKPRLQHSQNLENLCSMVRERYIYWYIV